MTTVTPDAPTLVVPLDRLLHAVRAVGPHASRDDELPFLSGLHIEGGPGHAMVVATDRFTMGVHRMDLRHRDAHPTDPPPDGTGFVATLDLPGLTKALSLLRPARRADIPQTMVTITLHGHYATLTGPSVDDVPAHTIPVRVDLSADGVDRFPAWRKLVGNILADPRPAAVPATVTLDPKKVARLNVPGAWSCRVYTGAKPTSATLVTVGPDLLVVIMPLRTPDMGDPDADLTLWQETLTATPEATP